MYKNKRFVFLLAIAGVFIAGSCQMREEDSGNDELAVFHAQSELVSDPVTKVAMSGMSVVWNKQDRISVFNKNSKNMIFEFAGQDGEQSGDFHEVRTPDNGNYTELPQVFAVYPYSEDITADKGGVKIVLPAKQAYQKDAFAPEANLMAACSDDRTLVFKNVGAYMCFRIFGKELSVKSLCLSGNKGEALAGNASLSLSTNSAPVLTFENGVDSLKLECATPVAVGSDEVGAVPFWMIVPPIVFQEGFTLSVGLSDGTYRKFVSTAKHSLTRSYAYKMAAIDLIIPDEPIDPESVPTVPGIYLDGEEAYIYAPGEHQINIYSQEGSSWYRFLVLSELKMYEIGPIPDILEEGDTFTADYAVTTAGVADSQPVSLTFTVYSVKDGVLTVNSGINTFAVLRY